ncbi:MAG TPA: ATP-binding protein [Solirubrobacterales bacterium]|nr:ATP-binding protein [Solirubrobacterales bacterium]
MLLRDRPLLQDRIDKAIYLPRPRLEDRLLQAVLQERNALLLGQWGSGKTTLLRKVEAALQESGRRTVWINARLADDAEGLLKEVALALSEVDRENQDDAAAVAEAPPAGLLPLVQELGSHQPAVIIIDELLDEQIAFDLFGRLRDELWAARHVWLAAATPQRAATLRTPPVEAFWSAVVEIPPLGPEEVSGLLERGLSHDELLKVRKNSAIAGVHPRELVREVERILEGDEDRSRRLGDLAEAAGRIGRSEEMAMTELIGLGRPASAHDDELLDRLGWSRAYTQRILSALESAQLVQTMSESNKDRTGRPRKLYTPNTRLPI